MHPLQHTQGKKHLEALYFYIVIQKWVVARIVKLVVNPYDYDLSVRTKLEPQFSKEPKKYKQALM
jgi:hypothetical protein